MTNCPTVPHLYKRDSGTEVAPEFGQSIKLRLDSNSGERPYVRMNAD